MKRCCEWAFPMPRTHTGVLMGNGRMGAMIWGAGRTLRITVGRADLWDRRGGMAWGEQHSYRNIRECLEAGDEQRLRSLFETAAGRAEGAPRRPTVLPVGRFDIELSPGATLERAVLDVDTGALALAVRRGSKRELVRLFFCMDRDALVARFGGKSSLEQIKPVPAWEYVGEHLADVGYQPPESFKKNGACGWVQALPSDPCVCAAASHNGRDLILCTALGKDAAAARAAGERVAAAVTADREQAEQKSKKWWADYWRSVPAVDIPDERFKFLYDYGMYKFGILTNPKGVAATLQGPWIEEYQMPPWSSDYHFNINVQMCYWPAFHGNRLQNLLPLFELIRSWLPTLRHNARVFLGIDDGLMLPHAVDDRCTCMGEFWTGIIDHGCTAWIAQMMFRYYLYSGDRRFLADTAFPFMKGAMRVYEEMLEREDDAFVLPVGVSPEYRGAAMNAWGRNASFQLACIHRLCEDLIDASAVLGLPAERKWQEVLERLPRAAVLHQNGHDEIALWEGTGLEESHRHHSHLAGITPFDIFDFEDAATADLLAWSLRTWLYRGPGLWSGWCVPWASMIHTRVGNADAAALWLEIWERVFTNEGGGTLHDVQFPGFSLMGRGSLGGGGRPAEVMQIEAGMAATAAIQEMLLHTRRGVTRLFKGAPARWERVAFADMLTEGGFLLSARRRGGRIGPITVKSQRGGVLALENPWSRPTTVTRADGSSELVGGDVLRIETRRGETVTVR